MAEIDSPWFTVAEAAKYAKVGEDTVARWLKEGHIHPATTRAKKNPRGPGRAGYLIEQSDLDRFLRSLKASVAESPADTPAEKPKAPLPRRANPPGEKTSDRLRREGL